MDALTLARAGDAFPGSAFAAPVYRIPALAVTGSGRVVAAYDVRIDWRDLPGDFDLVLRHSDDHGRSWSAPRALRRSAGGRGFGDASLIADTRTGLLHCWYVASTGRSFFTADAGPSGAGLELWLSTSADDGLTWTHRELTASLKPDDVTGMFASSGNGAVLASGRLLQPFVLRLTSGEHWAAVAHSDDGGDAWTLGERVGPDCDENKVVGLPDGRVLMHARATPRRRWAVSHDSGVTFTVPVPDAALVDPACNGGLCLLGDTLVCSHLDDAEERRRLVLRTSADAGATWSPALVVDPGAAAYSVLVCLADGALGVAYEAGDYTSVEFCRITRSELGLDDGPATLRARPGSTGAAKPPEVAPNRG